MNQLVSKAIVLSRTNYGEADRILTLLTPEQGKLRVMARGVRRVKSKLAGGIELFSVSDITYIQGRGEMQTLVSTRLVKHFGQIPTQLDRVQLGYELIRLINKVTEEQPEPAYYELLEKSFAALDDLRVSLPLIDVWFRAQLLQLGGHAPNLITDSGGRPLSDQQRYGFSLESMCFEPSSRGIYGAAEIKVMRLLFSNNVPQTLNEVGGLVAKISALTPVIKTMQTAQLSV